METVRREGKRIRTAHLEVRVSASLLSYPRIGVIVPRYRQTAVARNLVKRRLREISRKDLLTSLAPVDMVIRALPSAYKTPYSGLRDELQQVARNYSRAEPS